MEPLQNDSPRLGDGFGKNNRKIQQKKTKEIEKSQIENSKKTKFHQFLLKLWIRIGTEKQNR